jgi:ABC-type molybdate transport system substrate-binding protein
VSAANTASALQFLRSVLTPEGQDIAKAAGAFRIPSELAGSQLAALER